MRIKLGPLCASVWTCHMGRFRHSRGPFWFLAVLVNAPLQDVLVVYRLSACSVGDEACDHVLYESDQQPWRQVDGRGRLGGSDRLTALLLLRQVCTVRPLFITVLCLTSSPGYRMSCCYAQKICHKSTRNMCRYCVPCSIDRLHRLVL